MKQLIPATLVILLLYYTGLLSGVSEYTNQAVLKLGFKDFDQSPLANPEEFNYDFKIKSLEGKVIDGSELKGKVLFINLWATWCGPCRAEMPGIQSLYTKVDSSEIEFIMLSIDNPGNERKVESYIKNQKFTFPVYTPQGNLPEQFQVRLIPTTFIVGKDGKIASKKTGMTNFDTAKFKKFLEGLAKE